jgi:hypothetical protein
MLLLQAICELDLAGCFGVDGGRLTSFAALFDALNVDLVVVDLLNVGSDLGSGHF